MEEAIRNHITYSQLADVYYVKTLAIKENNETAIQLCDEKITELKAKLN